MAARQDQGLQIALIIFIFLFVGTFVLWYLYFRSASELQTQLTQVQSELRNEQSRAGNLQSENQRYRQMMGFDELENFDNVNTTFEQDMERFGKTFDESRRFYRDLLEYVHDENDRIAAREAAAKQQIKELNEKLLAAEAEKEKQIEQFEAQMKKSQEDAAAERNSFGHDRADLEATKKKLQENLDSQRTALMGQINELRAQLKKAETQLGKSERAKQNLLDERAVSSESFEVADGRISWVNQNGTVWINLGEADSLRRQVTFSVFDTDEHDAANAKKKGSIEVTRLLDDHMAEARVTHDDSRNPILTGDQIYSQVWERGKKLHFALTGIIDLNDDGESDLQLARDLIELNGGVVDAYVDDDGKVVGEMTVGTRYMVMGKYPEATRLAAQRDGWQAMSQDSKTLGIEEVSLTDFLNQMGYRPTEYIVPRGRASSARDPFSEPLTGDDSGDEFRPRGPSSVPTVTPY